MVTQIIIKSKILGFSSRNQRVPCDSQAIPSVDLRVWKDEIPAVP